MIFYWEKMRSHIKSIVNYKLLYSQTISDKSAYSNGKWLPGRKYLIVGSGFDIETSRIEYDSFVASYCYHWQFSLDEYTIGGRSLDSYENFLEFLISVLKRTGSYLLCLDANLGYEFQFCKRRWAKFGMSNLFAKERREPLKFDIADCIEMREVLGLFGNSLAQCAKDYCKTQKMVGDLDYSLVRLTNTPLTIKEQKYCENDVQILSELGHYIFDHYYGKNPKLPMTKTGIIRQKVKKKLGKNLKAEKERVQSNMPDEELYFFFRRFLFKGGICGTSALHMNKVLTNVVCADYTSDYPACMNHYKFPDGKMYEIPPDEFMSSPRLPYIATITFHEFRSKTPHSFMSLHKLIGYDRNNTQNYVIDNGRVHYAKEATFCVNDVEFKSLIKAYDWEYMDIHRAWAFEEYVSLPKHLMDVLNEEYLTKQSLKERGLEDTIEYKDSKAIVNGTFGMTCTALFMEDLIINYDEIEPNKTEDDKIIKKSYREAIKSSFLNPFWGFWITSYARSLLIGVITMFPKCIIQYDTDSIYYLKDHPQSPELEKFLVDYNEAIYEMNDIIFHGNKHYRDLGAWDIKKPFTRFKGLGSKRYMYEKNDGTIKTVVAGCRRGSIERAWKYAVEHNGYKYDIFMFFTNDMKISKELSGKLASKYVDDYYDKKYRELLVDYKDYRGNIETILLECSIVLEPIEFNMGLSPEHINFYRTLQGIYMNTPTGHPINEIIAEVLYGKD